VRLVFFLPVIFIIPLSVEFIDILPELFNPGEVFGVIDFDVVLPLKKIKGLEF